LGQRGIKSLQSHRAHHATTSNASQRKVEVPNKQKAPGIADTSAVLAFLAIGAKMQDEGQRRPIMRKMEMRKDIPQPRFPSSRLFMLPWTAPIRLPTPKCII